jgi:hypothetical protein
MDITEIPQMDSANFVQRLVELVQLEHNVIHAKTICFYMKDHACLIVVLELIKMEKFVVIVALNVLHAVLLLVVYHVDQDS